MKLKRILDQHRRDFQGVYECQYCGNEETDTHLDSYDDAYYHQNVIPNMKCKECGKSTKSEGDSIDTFKTKYPEEYQI